MLTVSKPLRCTKRWKGRAVPEPSMAKALAAPQPMHGGLGLIVGRLHPRALLECLAQCDRPAVLFE
jgi:hypothetical protein